MSQLLSRAEIEMIQAWEKDTRYEKHNPLYLREIRDRVYASKSSTKYEKSLIQYWLMKKEGRLDSLFNER